MQINILKNGELVRDTGILYFYRMLREIDEDNRIQPKLHRNHLSFEMPAEFDMKKALFTQIVTELYRAFVRDLIVEKLSDDLLNKLEVAPKEHLIELLEAAKVSPDKIKKIVAKSQKIYFPYLRNSGKFGANAGTVANFHQNLKELLQLFLDSLLKQREHLELYGEGSNCSVCQENTAPLYDITHKYAIETIEKMKPNKRIVRTDSKYLYTFKGSENNTFSNYGRVNQYSSVCFECEFFNLLFLLYVKVEKPQYLVMTDSLEITYLLQRKIQMKKNVYTTQAFYYQVAGLGRSSKVRLYRITTDANQGILLQTEEIIEYERLKVQLILMDLVDKFSFPDQLKNRNELINQLKKHILNDNYDGAYRLLLDNIGIDDETRLAHNYKLLGNFITETMNSLEIRRKETMMNEMKNRGKIYWHFGNSFSRIENKKNLGFRLTQLLRSDNRTRMHEDLLHLYFTTTEKGNDESFSNFPNWLAEDILCSSTKEYHYYVGQIIQGLLTVKKENKI
ncbi:hypothetical protein JZO70_01240 [Enterococcus sp. 669A]|uniref:CRISPR-associated protein CXXC-CXXC domain-containing protein n=1 Tax=Candidatus Enterococcus moelleringii TaxID=2815325 RepID=A0ABS3L585_9ENTE|nr:hypothetical protein [Enterococcus sp. 669A]MBO1304767.1 hypothetical protein [Enterococcus sp. 669A]